MQQVKSVAWGVFFYLLIETAVAADVPGKMTQLSPGWGLDRTDQRVNTLNDRYQHNLDGTGVHIYIVDGGVRGDHPELVGRMGKSVDKSDPDAKCMLGGSIPEDGGDTGESQQQSATPSTGFKHGTAVASIAAGSTTGIAKNATIHSVRVLNDKGCAESKHVEDGLAWVLNNVELPAVVNLSFWIHESSLLRSQIDQLIDMGIPVIAAAGNSNSNCNVFPGKYPKLISVAATDKSNTLASFSNYGDCVDLLAPGKGIRGALADSDSYLYSTWDGTSFAAPYVAGASALILQSNLSSSADDARDTLVANATSDKVNKNGKTVTDDLLHSRYHAGPLNVSMARRCSGSTSYYDFSWSPVAGAVSYELDRALIDPNLFQSGDETPQGSEYWRPIYSGSSTSATWWIDQTFDEGYLIRVRACFSDTCAGYEAKRMIMMSCGGTPPPYL